MDANVNSVQKVFSDQHRYIVPPYQRPYVWTEDDQWLPLWEDIERIAESRLTGEDDSHFLGAIVIRLERTTPGGVTEWSVIDGQQRLTTLQVLVSATAYSAEHDGCVKDARLLRRLMLHDEDLGEGDEQFKFWPTTLNRKAFKQVVAFDLDSDITVDDPNNTIHEAWGFFRTHAQEFVRETGEGEDVVAERYTALREAICGLLKIVVIDLEKQDPAQVIFETLNARGTPLLAMDLVKNALFDKAESEGVDVEKLHEEVWASQLGTGYWREEVRQGRLTVTRTEPFLTHWLVMQLGEIVPSERIFDLFRSRVIDSAPAAELLARLNDDAGVLRRLTDGEAGAEAASFMALNKVMDTTTFHPVAMLLARRKGDDEDVARAFHLLESFLARRMLTGMSTKNYTQLAAKLAAAINELGESGSAADVIAAELLGSDANAFRWPSDEEVESHLVNSPTYGWVNQRRVVHVFSRIELRRRTGKTEAIQELPAKLQLEHLMPQSWMAHWPLGDGDQDALADVRNGHLDRIGNLTLVTPWLNVGMSNEAWSKKGPALEENSLLMLNRELTKEADWNEESIDRRSSEISKEIFEIWPGPQEFQPEGWETPEHEIEPDRVRVTREQIAEVLETGSDELKALLTYLADRADERQLFSDVGDGLGWDSRRLPGILGGYTNKYATKFDGARIHHVNLDERGRWWIWLDEERAAMVHANSGDQVSAATAIDLT